jgi:DNA-directed RNA polymerase specialized sigma24 family protein
MIGSVDPQITRLVREAQTGDQEAFTALYRHYGALVYRTAYLLLGDTGRAEELTQDVFVRLSISPTVAPSRPGCIASPSAFV